VNGLFDDAKTTAGHSRRALRSGVLSIVARGVNAVVQIGSVLFLARLLSPEDYGVVAMMTAITGFGPLLVDLGTRDAIVQRQRITEGEVSALFWMTLAIGIGCALAVASSGALIARFYGEPRLTSIALVSSLAFIGNALQCQHYALMRRGMMFQELAVVEVGSNLVGAAIAVALAFTGYSYWALVIRPVATTFLLSGSLFVLTRWLPTRPTFTSGVKDMVKFGLNLTGFTMTDFFTRSSDRIGLGYRVGATGLGYYQNAMFVYDNIIDLIASPLHNVAVASLSKLRGDMTEFRRLWAKALTTLTFFAMPVFGVLAVTSRDVIVLMLGSKWSSAGVLLSILALRGIPQSVERTLGWLHITADRTDRWMRWGLVAIAVHLVALAIGLPFGPMGVVVAFVIVMFALCIPALVYAGRPLNIGLRDIIAAIGPQTVGSLAAVAIGFWLRSAFLSDFSMLARTVVLTLGYGATYLTIVAGVFRVRAPMVAVLSLAGDLSLRRVARARDLEPLPKAVPGYEHI
jgi:polysaccharide transporter, PST family